MTALLMAFILNLLKRLTQDDLTYIGLNIAGGGLSTYYAVSLDAFPFIILEGVWTLFALFKLFKVLKVI
ncbi:MAG: hypothetical protein HRF51_01410 [bacterium]